MSSPPSRITARTASASPSPVKPTKRTLPDALSRCSVSTTPPAPSTSATDTDWRIAPRSPVT